MCCRMIQLACTPDKGMAKAAYVDLLEKGLVRSALAESSVRNIYTLTTYVISYVIAYHIRFCYYYILGVLCIGLSLQPPKNYSPQAWIPNNTGSQIYWESNILGSYCQQAANTKYRLPSRHNISVRALHVEDYRAGDQLCITTGKVTTKGPYLLLHMY
jgi:hypothetical protein